MQKLLIATTNPGKVKEMQKLLASLPVKLVSLTDVGITQEVAETGTTYEENAALKAQTYAQLSSLPAISDDGGLEIAFLSGEPGVQSKYWAGPEGKDEAIREKMKKIIKTLPQNNRHARFVVVNTFALPTGKVWHTKGVIEGLIAEKPSDAVVSGYPYSSFFYIPSLQKYYLPSLLTDEEKSQYNHRYKAITALKKIIQEQLGLIK